MKSFTCLVKKEGDQYASLCIELDVASCGRTKKEALQGLRRTIETYLEFMNNEGRQDDIYRPVPMNELRRYARKGHSMLLGKEIAIVEGQKRRTGLLPVRQARHRQDAGATGDTQT